MSVINDSFWSLQLDPSRTIPLTPEEPEDFIHEISGRILCGDARTDRDHIAGMFRVYYADFELGQNHNVSAHYILDAHQHTLDYAEAVLDSDGAPFPRRLYNLLGDDIWNFNLLILDRVELLPRYRGNSSGLIVLRSLIERFGAGAGVVGMKPFPLQFEPKASNDSKWRRRLKLEEFPSDIKRSTRKLRAYYERLGFVPMKSTSFMFLSMSWALPSVQQLRS